MKPRQVLGLVLAGLCGCAGAADDGMNDDAVTPDEGLWTISELTENEAACDLPWAPLPVGATVFVGTEADTFMFSDATCELAEDGVLSCRLFVEQVQDADILSNDLRIDGQFSDARKLVASVVLDQDCDGPGCADRPTTWPCTSSWDAVVVYDRPRSTERYEAIVALSGDPIAGQGVYDAACALCHGVGGDGGETSPPLIGAGPYSRDFLISVAVDGRRRMPAPELADQEVADVVAYVQEAFLVR